MSKPSHSEKKQLIDTVKPPPGWGSRHNFTALAFLGFCVMYLLRVNLSVAIVAMVKAGEF